jgi:hypothetical protein
MPNHANQFGWVVSAAAKGSASNNGPMGDASTRTQVSLARCSNALRPSVARSASAAM